MIDLHCHLLPGIDDGAANIELSVEMARASFADGITVTAWPWVALASWLLLLAGGALALFTAGRWRSGGRRYRTTPVPHEGPVDAVESWDELSRGTDPTR